MEGFEDVHVSLSNRGDLSPRVIRNLWSGNGEEPSNYEFDIDFDDFYDVNQTRQIQVILTNSGNEKIVPVHTTVIPEIKKQICYFGPSSLRVTFLHQSEGVLSDYSNNIVNAVVPTGACRDFYLIYNQGYFYELLVHTDPDAVGWLGNWNQDQYDETGNGFVYTYRPVDADPMNVKAKVKEYDDSGYYYVDLTLENISPNTIFIY